MKPVRIPLTECFEFSIPAVQNPNPLMEIEADSVNDLLEGDASPCVKTRHRKNKSKPAPHSEDATPQSTTEATPTPQSATEAPVQPQTIYKREKPFSHKAGGTGARAIKTGLIAAGLAQQAEQTAKCVTEGWQTVKTVCQPHVGGRAGAKPTKEGKEKARAKARGAEKFE